MHRARVKVTLSEDASVAIRRLSLASGESMSAMISSLFDPNVSELNDMANLLEHANQIRQEIPETSRHFFRSVISQIRDDINTTKPEPESPRETVARSTPKERFKAETNRLNAIAEQKKADLKAASEVPEMDALDIEEAEMDRLESRGNYYD